MYTRHKYPDTHIWNCDESEVQAGRNGGGRVLAKKWIRSVHTVTPDEREWLSVLSCINASGTSIPNFYIFEGRSFRRNFIIRCEEGVCMAMQKKTWMTGTLFNEWINHFLPHVGQMYGISNENRHLLIMDGHNSHVTLDIAHTTRKVGLDLLTIPSHTSHATQPLEVSIFNLFKTAFRKYQDFWTHRNKGKGAAKEDLAQWVSLALKKAMTPTTHSKRVYRNGYLAFKSDSHD